MTNTYYIHDAGTGKLVVTNIVSLIGPGMEDDFDRAVMRVAKRAGMDWGDCSWGSVDAISINI